MEDHDPVDITRLTLLKPCKMFLSLWILIGIACVAPLTVITIIGGLETMRQIPLATITTLVPVLALTVDKQDTSHATVHNNAKPM
jgi:hypothetical protein